jgi:hypothetical protein
MNVYYLIDGNHTLYGVYKTEEEAEAAKGEGMKLSSTELFVSSALTSSSCEYWDLYFAQIGTEPILLRAPDFGNAAADAVLYCKESGITDATFTSLVEYGFDIDSFGVPVSIKGEPAVIGSAAREVLSALTVENRDLVALLLSEIFYSHSLDPEELYETEKGRNSWEAKHYGGIDYTGLGCLSLELMLKLTHSEWHNICTVENCEDLGELNFLSSDKKCKDTDELLYYTSVLEARFGYECRFPYALYLRLTDGRANSFSRYYYENIRGILYRPYYDDEEE